MLSVVFRKSAVLALSAILVAGAMPTLAQDPKDQPVADKPVVAKKTYDASRRVPPYFGQIGLTPEQKESIYKIRSRHVDKIEELQKQIVEIQAAMLAECETQLTDTQKKLLEHRRESASKTKKAAPANEEGKAKEPVVVPK